MKANHKGGREPFARLVKRENAGFFLKISVRLLAIFIALLLILIFVNKVTGYSFNKILTLMTKSAFGTDYSKRFLFKNMAMLLLVGLALAPAFKMKFWNIGAQGQVLMGALLTSLIMIKIGSKYDNFGLYLLMIIGSVAAGGLWALIPAFFKVRINANETLFTLMLNYVAIKIVASAVDAWKGPNASLGLINTISQAGYLNKLGENPYGWVILSAILLTVLMYVYMRHTKQGYEISVVGESINTARYAGINTKKVILRTMFLSGAIAGFCGFLYIAGIDHTLATNTGGSYGFTAIIVAWAAKFNPFIMALIALLIVFLEKGSTGITDTTSNLNSYTAYIIVGIFLLFLIGCEFFINYKIVYNSRLTAWWAGVKEKFERKFPRLSKFFKRISSGASIIEKRAAELLDALITVLKGIFLSAAKKMKPIISKVFKKKKSAATVGGEAMYSASTAPEEKTDIAVKDSEDKGGKD
jgi:simple sugar transport system permease protein